MLLNEKYPGGMSQKQRLLAMEEAHALANGYSYFDNGEDDKYSVATSNSDSSTSSPQRTNRKVGKRLMITKSDQ